MIITLQYNINAKIIRRLNDYRLTNFFRTNDRISSCNFSNRFRPSIICLDDPISENGDAEKEVTILTYVDRSFEQDLTFIDGLVKTRSRSFLSDPSQLEFEKVLSKYMIILWSLEAYPDLITGIEPEDRSQIQEFVEKKLLDFAKGEDLRFSPNIFMKALRKTSEVGMSELDFAQRDHIIEPFKVKIVKDQEVISRRKRIINGLISEITLKIPTKL